jgi:hypothetical protein
MSFQPRSLIQVHYHDRLGGVNKVVQLYAKAFDSLTAGRAKGNFVVCSKSKSSRADFRPAEIVSIPLCDYQEFSSKKQYERIKASLVKSLDRVLSNKKIKKPVCVIGHNLTIGKNCALSAAFAEVARQYSGSKNDIRFYSIIHDFAEEGRLDCLEKIEKVKKWTDIEKDLFPTDGSVRFITLNACNASFLKKAGFPVAMLSNPVDGHTNRSLSLSKGAVWSKNRALRSFDRAQEQQAQCTVLYPSRCISRKNILEAILLCNFIYKSNLMIGASGTASNEVIAFNKVVALCKRYRLPVMFDYGSILADKSIKGIFTNKAFDIADACMTTSIAEGFGYNLFEPWLYGKAVFGRRYLGFSPIAGFKFNSLYDRLPIPIDWISVMELREKYWEAMNKCFGNSKKNELLSNRKKFNSNFNEYFIENETIDFGCLDVLTQFTIVESLLKSPDKIEAWEIACKDQLSIIRNFANTAICKSEKIIRFNQDRINKHFSLNSFSKKFEKILSQNPPTKSQPGSREEIMREFCTFERFRLLLAT